MKFFKRNGQPMPEHIVEMAEKVKEGADGVNRREFLALASVFGATAATAYAMIGLPTPALADGHAAQPLVRLVERGVRLHHPLWHREWCPFHLPGHRRVAGRGKQRLRGMETAGQVV